jgi:hypothetical protein
VKICSIGKEWNSVILHGDALHRRFRLQFPVELLRYFLASTFIMTLFFSIGTE